MNEAVIEARDVTKRYKDVAALDYVDLTVRRNRRRHYEWKWSRQKSANAMRAADNKNHVSKRRAI